MPAEPIGVQELFGVRSADDGFVREEEFEDVFGGEADVGI